MMRQVHELASAQYGVQGRLVSERPINPINLADQWELAALKEFNKEKTEISQVTMVEGNPNIRYIRPFYVEEGCLYCHKHQGYQVGDLRGAISTQTSFQPYLDIYYANAINLSAGHGIIWLFGLLGIRWTARRLEESTKIIVSEEKYRTIVENSNDAIYLHDFKGRIIDLNEQASRMLGYQREELIGTSLEIVSGAESRLHMQERIATLIKQGSLVFEGVDVHKDGREIPVEISARVVSQRDNGLIQSFVRDISQRKKVEQELLNTNKKLEEAIVQSKRLAKQAEEASKAKSQFLANMSHEIRTPMNAVLGMTELLEEHYTSPEQKTYVEILKKNGDNLLSIINAILDLAKVESGKMELNLKKTEIGTIIKEIGATYKVLAEKKGLQLTIAPELSMDKKHYALADEDKIRQVLINLVSNSLKFTHQGEINVSFNTTNKPSLIFSVQDTGIGISKEKMEQIFYAFNQGDVAATQTYSGTGLGLTISKKLVELMGGTIWVDSTLGHGSTFYFEIPYQELGEREYNEKDKNEPDNIISTETDILGPMRVLLVEDNEDNRVLIKALLKKEQLHIDVAENGLDALNKYIQVNGDINENPYKLIFMDMQMPVMDGYQATREIRAWEQNAGLNPVAIFALTAYALQEEKAKSIAAGCTGHLTKPIKKEEILQVIREIASTVQSDLA